MKVTFVIADTWSTTMALVHENEFRPYKKRTVTIELTEEQKNKLERKYVGRDSKPRYEEIIDCFVENEHESDPENQDK